METVAKLSKESLSVSLPETRSKPIRSKLTNLRQP